jgi:hypothetical protein
MACLDARILFATMFRFFGLVGYIIQPEFTPNFKCENLNSGQCTFSIPTQVKFCSKASALFQFQRTFSILPLLFGCLLPHYYRIEAVANGMLGALSTAGVVSGEVPATAVLGGRRVEKATHPSSRRARGVLMAHE